MLVYSSLEAFQALSLFAVETVGIPFTVGAWVLNGLGCGDGAGRVAKARIMATQRILVCWMLILL